MTTSQKSKNKHSTFPQIKGNLETDVVVIGAGITGLLVAYELGKRGKRVVILESDRIGQGATALTTAFITQAIDTPLHQLQQMFGGRKAREIWESHGAAIDLIEEIIRKHKIDCGFMRASSMIFAADKKQIEDVQEDYRLAKKLGFPVVLRDREDLPFSNFGILELKNQAKFYAAEFIAGLTKVLVDRGVQIFEKSEVVKISGTEKLPVVETRSGSASAFDVVIATYDPFGNPKKTVFKKGMYVSYVFKVQIPKGYLPEQMYLDNDNPYYYFRVDGLGDGSEYDHMIIGGEDHRKELRMDPKKNFASLEKYLGRIVPKSSYKILTKWTGPILESSDGLALIGRLKPHRYVACAFSGNGMTYAPISALIIADMIEGKKNPWVKLYDPTRIPSLKQLYKKGSDYVMEFVHGALENWWKY